MFGFGVLCCVVGVNKILLWLCFPSALLSFHDDIWKVSDSSEQSSTTILFHSLKIMVAFTLQKQCSRIVSSNIVVLQIIYFYKQHFLFYSIGQSRNLGYLVICYNRLSPDLSGALETIWNKTNLQSESDSPFVKETTKFINCDFFKFLKLARLTAFLFKTRIIYCVVSRHSVISSVITLYGLYSNY